MHRGVIIMKWFIISCTLLLTYNSFGQSKVLGHTKKELLKLASRCLIERNYPSMLVLNCDGSYEFYDFDTVQGLCKAWGFDCDAEFMELFLTGIKKEGFEIMREFYAVAPLSPLSGIKTKVYCVNYLKGNIFYTAVYSSLNGTNKKYSYGIVQGVYAPK